MQHKRVCVIGLGYIGLPTAALLASKGYDVAGVDLNVQAVDTINAGKIHIVEPDLDAFVRSAVAAQRLKAYTTPQLCDVYIICVPTPFHEGKEIPEPNIDYVLTATRSIARLVKSGDIVILESTSPVGTTQMLEAELKKAGTNTSDIFIAYCPERVLPGKIMIELVENDRIVGGLNAESTRIVADFYKTFVHGEVLETDAKTAEMCKLTENSFRDVNIAFANELSMVCAKEQINVWDLINLANRHPRVNILQPGAGVGGHCIAVDPWFIVAKDPENAKLIRTAREVNNFKTNWVVDQIRAVAMSMSSKIGRPPKIACLGLAFKPDIDDLRESPAVRIVQELNEDSDVCVVEPNIKTHAEFTLVTLKQALESADLFVFLVRHSQFFDPVCKAKMQHLAVIDFCGALRQ